MAISASTAEITTRTTSCPGRRRRRRGRTRAATCWSAPRVTTLVMSDLHGPAPGVAQLQQCGDGGDDEDDAGDGAGVAHVVLAECVLVEPGTENLACVVRASGGHDGHLV